VNLLPSSLFLAQRVRIAELQRLPIFLLDSIGSSFFSFFFLFFLPPPLVARRGTYLGGNAKAIRLPSSFRPLFPLFPFPFFSFSPPLLPASEDASQPLSPPFFSPWFGRQCVVIGASSSRPLFSFESASGEEEGTARLSFPSPPSPSPLSGIRANYNTLSAFPCPPFFISPFGGTGRVTARILPSFPGSLTGMAGSASRWTPAPLFSFFSRFPPSA